MTGRVKSLQHKFLQGFQDLVGINKSHKIRNLQGLENLADAK